MRSIIQLDGDVLLHVKDEVLRDEVRCGAVWQDHRARLEDFADRRRLALDATRRAITLATAAFPSWSAGQEVWDLLSGTGQVLNLLAWAILVPVGPWIVWHAASWIARRAARHLLGRLQA